MKKNLYIVLALLSLTACAATPEQPKTPAKVGMANPASQYCVEQGGQLDIRNETNGQVGYCKLPNGQIVEEWALFRASQTKCLPEQAQKLVGQAALTEAQIQQKTSAEIVRLIEPNQPVTMDYRENRVTVTVDPKTQKITQSNCG